MHVFLPSYIPAILFRFHLLTYHLYLALVSLEETFVYSGYNVLPSAFILGGIARRQERHLMGDGDGNFGCFGLVDFALGTSLGQDLAGDVREEVEEETRKKQGKPDGKEIRKKKSRERQAIDKTKENGEQVVGGAEDEDEGGEEEASRTRKRGPRRRPRG